MFNKGLAVCWQLAGPETHCALYTGQLRTPQGTAICYLSKLCCVCLLTDLLLHESVPRFIRWVLTHFIMLALIRLIPSPVVQLNVHTLAQQYTRILKSDAHSCVRPSLLRFNLFSFPWCFPLAQEEKIWFTPPQVPCSCTDMENDFSAAWAYKQYFGFP